MSKAQDNQSMPELKREDKPPMPLANGGEAIEVGAQSATVEKKENRLIFTAKYLAKVGIFSALAYILYLFVKFPVPFIFPSWLEVNFADIPALIGGFALGPLGGALIVLVRILLKLPFSQTGFSGEIADLLLGLAFVLPSAFIYKYNRTLKGAVIAMVVGSLCSTLMAVFTNRFIVVPWFVEVTLKGDWTGIVNMLRPLFPNVTAQNFYNYYLWLSVVPFNLLRCLLASLATGFSYKHISRLLAKM